MKSNSLKLAFLSFLSVAMLVPGIARAETFTVDGKTYQTPETPREKVKFAFEFMKSRKDVVNLMKASQVSDESVRFIEADLQKRANKKDVIPAMTIKNDEIFLDDKASGIVIVSYSPLRVKYQGRTWSARSNMTPDQNYKSFTRFIEKPQSFSLLPLFVPGAHAFFGFNSLGNGMLSGLSIGALGGGLISWLSGGSIWNGVLWGGLLGTGVGGAYGWSNGDKRGATGFF